VPIKYVKVDKANLYIAKSQGQILRWAGFNTPITVLVVHLFTLRASVAPLPRDWKRRAG